MDRVVAGRPRRSSCARPVAEQIEHGRWRRIVGSRTVVFFCKPASGPRREPATKRRLNLFRAPERPPVKSDKNTKSLIVRFLQNPDCRVREFLRRSRQRGIEKRSLQLDKQPERSWSAAGESDDVGKQWNPLAVVWPHERMFARASATGPGSSHIETCDLGTRKIADSRRGWRKPCTAPVARKIGVEAQIMNHYDIAALGELDIEFGTVHAERHGISKGSQGVFRRKRGAATMSD